MVGICVIYIQILWRPIQMYKRFKEFISNHLPELFILIVVTYVSIIKILLEIAI